MLLQLWDQLQALLQFSEVEGFQHLWRQKESTDTMSLLLSPRLCYTVQLTTDGVSLLPFVTHEAEQKYKCIRKDRRARLV